MLFKVYIGILILVHLVTMNALIISCQISVKRWLQLQFDGIRDSPDRSEMGKLRQ